MPVNKVLLPNNAGMDFAPGGGSIGWVPMSAGNTLLSVAENIIKDGNANNLEDHAIPSPIAYIKHFKHKLDHDNPDAINEWRGMLAAIALQKVKGFDITIKDIPIFPDPNTGNPTAFGKVLCEELVSNSDITGYELVKTPAGTLEPNYKTLSVFCKDGIPFAMFMPSMLICPFKHYPIDLFSGLQWYDDTNRFAGDGNKDPKGTWLTVRDKITNGPTLSVTAQKLYLWIQSLISAFPWPIVTGFGNYIQGDLAAPVPSATINPVMGNYAAGANVYLQLKNICPLPQGAPTLAFSEKVLFIVPQADFFDGIDPETQKNYIIDKGGFTPMKRHFFGQNAPVYVVPPIHPQVVESIKSGNARLSQWRFDAVGDKYKCEYHLHFPTGEVLSYVRKFSNSEIAWTETMPYISMWPYVNFTDDSWKEHYIAVCANNEGLGGQLNDYSELVDNTDIKHILGKASSSPEYIECPEIKISLVAKRANASVCAYKCNSEFNKQEIKLLSSDSQPFALEFSYVDAGVTYKLGSWIIDRKAAPEVSAQPSKTYYVAMDFGTTSTNVYLREDNNLSRARSISSAGKYLCDIYNPYAHMTYDGRCESGESDFIQNYYLFSSSNKELGKIFTYGQNFTAVKDGIPVGGTVSNASGRMVVVDETFILEGEIGGNSRIWNGLKMKLGNNEKEDIERDKATNNFICNALTYAVLEAKAEGASAIKLRVSYPSDDLGDVAIRNIGPICADLQVKSGIAIELKGSTEARAAGEYFATSNALTAAQRPSAAHGYAIVDIGGGTTDFSFWKADDGGDTPKMKAEFSFGYAGNYLIERSIIQGLSVSNNFNQIWSYNTNLAGSVESRALERYSKISVPKLIGSNPGQDFFQKVATIDFLLERCAVNAEMLNGPQYSDFLSVVRMKYYALFMLIASYIKRQIKQGTIEISPINFRICLAGCGSKGMEFARMGSKGMDFDKKLSEIFEGMLSLSKDRFAVVAPVTDNKEEVVIGLTYVSDGINIGGAATPIPVGGAVGGVWDDDDEDAVAEPAAEVIATAPAQPAVGASYEELEKAYSRLVARLAHLELPLGADNKPVHNGTSLVDKINCNYPEARAYFNGIFAEVENQTKRAKPSADTYADTFALLMLENMIEYFI